MGEMWYYTCEGKQMDPVTMKELSRLVGDGTLKPTDMVWKDGMPRWIRASSLKELFPDPMTALDKYFTNTQGAEKKAPQFSGTTAPSGKSSQIAAVESAPTPTGSPPKADEEPQRKKRKPSDSEKDADSERPPPRRRAESQGGGSNIGIIIALVMAAIVLLGGLLVGVIILVVAIKPDDQKPPIVGGDKKEIKDIKELPVTPINGTEKYDVQIPANGVNKRTFTFRQGVAYDFRVKCPPGLVGAQLHLFVFRNNNQEAGDDGPGTERVLRWTPRENGDYRVELRNVAGGQEVRGEVTIKEAKQGVAKNDPLPKGVRDKQGVVESLKSIAPNGNYLVRFRAAAGHAATITATPLGGGANANLKIFVTKEGDPNTIVTDEGNNAVARVNFTLQNSETVLVRVQNAGKTSTKIRVIYDVSP